MLKSPSPRALLLALAIVAAMLPLTALPATAEDPGQIWFPVQTPGMHYSDTWGAARSGGRSHTATDIMAPQMNEVYATVDGTIFSYEGDCAVGEYCSAYYLLISGDDGRSYFYVHLNNDTPGRPNGCDGRGGIDNAFSPRLVDEYHRNGGLKGVRVSRGEHIAYNGSSGNAGCGVDHTHFEIWNGHGWGSPKVNPYTILRAAEDAGNVWGAEGAIPAPVNYGRIAGANRVLTSVEMSKWSFPSGARAAVLAPAEVYPEALLSGPLAATLGGPVLMTWNHQAAGRDVLDDAVANELRRLGVERVIVVGNTDRFDAAVEEQLRKKVGLPASAIERVAAADRYELSARIAELILEHHGFGPRGPLDPPASGQTISPILALGEHESPSRGWPDALSASSLASRQVTPILLTRTADLPDATAKVLEREGLGEVRIVGGPAAISDEVERAVAQTGHETRRLAGSNRYLTSIAIANEMLELEGTSLKELWIATGLDFPDALAAGQAAAHLGYPLILVDGSDPFGAPNALEWARERAGEIKAVLGIGGPAVVRHEVIDRMARYANWPR